jgi:hypothetical protein
MLCRSTCPIIESCLNVVADGLEFIFDTKTEVRFDWKKRTRIYFDIFFLFVKFSSEIELLFMDDKNYFSSFDKNNFRFRSSNHVNSQLSPTDIRSLILADDNAIECLFKLYQFYELYSEPVSLFCFLFFFWLCISFCLNRLINILEKIMSVYCYLFIISLYKFVNYLSQIIQLLFDV